jgi:DNA polymerase-3 subunit epsilon
VTIPSNSAATLGQTPFAVVDLETTGVYPGRHDRVIEIAIVRLGPDLDIDTEWVTLVNPARDIGRTDVHGIRAGDVADAPRFEEIAGDAAIRLRDAVIVGHHLRFDLGFLTAEFSRLGATLPEVPGLCTLDLAYRFLPDAPSRKLETCCVEVGVLHEDQHTALGDARATAGLLCALIERARHAGASDLVALGCHCTDLSGNWDVGARPSGKRLSRAAGAARRADERTYLARLVEGMLGDEARNPREAEYLALVDRALEDRRVTSDEAALLLDMAVSWGMTRSDVLEAHRAYLGSLASEALRDRQVSDAERGDLEEVCDLLGLHRAALAALLQPPAPGRGTSASRPASGGREPGLRGKSVCFTGELIGMLGGARITRETAEKLAMEAGLEVRATVTKRLDLLVVADPDTQSGKARKARDYGTRIMAEPAFWRALGVPVETT